MERANEELREKLAAAGVETGSVIEQSVEDMTEDAVTGQTAATGNSSVHDHQVTEQRCFNHPPIY